MFAVGGLGTVSNPQEGVKTGITAMLTLFYLAFTWSWAPIYHIIGSEVPNSRKSFLGDGQGGRR